MTYVPLKATQKGRAEMASRLRRDLVTVSMAVILDTQAHCRESSLTICENRRRFIASAPIAASTSLVFAACEDDRKSPPWR